MTPKYLQPRFDLLCEEYVLVQAWKKTAAYIRYHNWFSDSLALDRTTVNIRQFLSRLRERLRSRQRWQNHALRIVPAPKKQHWRICPKTGAWEPVEKNKTSERLRPLAHVNLEEQVLATALMLCLADRVETAQGDPRDQIVNLDLRRRVVSYGNRLFCDYTGRGDLRHRWGSTKLYRGYFEDYRKFLSRPDTVANHLLDRNKPHVFVVFSDLRQFFDRVRPRALFAALESIRHESDDPKFFDFARNLLDWTWDSRDVEVVTSYAEHTGLGDFDNVALPQGLVAAGFFSNVVLLRFDSDLKEAIGTEVQPGIFLADACRYVDDLRLTVSVEFGPHTTTDDLMVDVKRLMFNWLSQLLARSETSLKLSDEKTIVMPIGGQARSSILQNKKMNRIQSAISGGFDALGGSEILDAIHGLMGTQQELKKLNERAWQITPLSDVRDETVYRFAAARFRTTFRSIRPLLDGNERIETTETDAPGPRSSTYSRVPHTQQQLDQDAKAFALGLIQRWIDDPSNVRLLRIGLDLWPHVEVLQPILSLLRPYTEEGEHSMARRRVAWYCLSEVLKAGATETGLVPDGESLPSDINLKSYRAALCEEAGRLVMAPVSEIPWYLRQQALLFLAACKPSAASTLSENTSSETRHYWNIIRFLRRRSKALSSAEFATLSVVARRAFVSRDHALELTRSNLTPARIRSIAHADPSFLLELLPRDHFLVSRLPPRAREDLCYVQFSASKRPPSLARMLLHDQTISYLRNELSVLYFSKAFLQSWRRMDVPPYIITPKQVLVEYRVVKKIAIVDGIRILRSRVRNPVSLYEPPEWCTAEARWRFQLGFLLRFILSGHPDFTLSVRQPFWKEDKSAYRPANSHWYQRLYGLYSGQPAFGDDWLPITDWMEQLLLALLRWPGCRSSASFDSIEKGIGEAMSMVSERIEELRKRLGPATGELILPMIASRPSNSLDTRSLRACVVQTVIPDDDDLKRNRSDLALNDLAFRKKHRQHLSTALEAVRRMLRLRATHLSDQLGIDLLILPELSVHPMDVHTHLIPFSRIHKTIILTGLTYQRLMSGQPLVNSSLWIFPEWSRTGGLQVRTRRQGKEYLSPEENALNQPNQLIHGFRPCQWLVGYPWSNNADEPVWLTASICYDATDLRLAADLRDQSDVFIIPALNKDVTTFDQMALALHYHMFQLVVVANNGKYGGSNAYWPKRTRPQDQVFPQIFHIHGQPQATIAFLEIDDISNFLTRTGKVAASKKEWKSPPAGLI